MFDARDRVWRRAGLISAVGTAIGAIAGGVIEWSTSQTTGTGSTVGALVGGLAGAWIGRAERGLIIPMGLISALLYVVGGFVIPLALVNIGFFPAADALGVMYVLSGALACIGFTAYLVSDHAPWN